MLIFLLIFKLNILTWAYAQNTVDKAKRIDCYPDPNPSQAGCLQRGCNFDGSDWDPAMGNPTCFFPPNTGYIAEDSIDSNVVTLKKSPSSVSNLFGQDFQELVFHVDEIGSGLHITIVPKNQTRYRPLITINPSPMIQSSDKLNIIKNNDTIFSFIIQRQSSGERIWDTSIGGLLYADKFLQIAAYLASDRIYGFGEHVHTSIKHDLSSYVTWGMFTNGGLGNTMLNTNLYGVHPFYMGIEDDGKAHGVFFFNSNAQEVTLGPAPHLVYRTIGGQLEFFFFPGPTPEEVIQQFQQVIGTPFLPAYWALGFHICRYGYSGTKEVEKVVNRTWSYNIPFDVAWADIDYMQRYKDFTLDTTNWGDFGNYTDYLHKQGMRVILITDPVIEVDYGSFQRGLQQNASFVEWPRYDMVPQNVQTQYPLANGTKIMLGSMWPDFNVAWPDFLDPTGQTAKWWSNEFALFRQTVAIDGMWIDMNEPAVFGTGFYTENSTSKDPQIKSPKNLHLMCPDVGPDSEYDSPPYLTKSGYGSGKLASSSLCMCADTARNTQKFYNTRSLYGYSEMAATSYALKNAIGKRGAIISRSTFSGSGSYGGHWTGDNDATWDDLKYSIIAIQEFNMFGIPFVGADICGFHGATTTEDMCLRWQQLGAFYPFSRNHNLAGAPDHDPGVWPSVAAATRKANLFRYRHLPYLYSLHFSVSLKGGTVARPVLFEFPNNPTTYDLSMQFMWGPAMMIIPVTSANATSVNGYLPIDAIWYSAYDYFYGSPMENGFTDFQAPTNYLIPVFVRGGYILPRQRPSVTTTLSRQNEMQLLIALDTKNTAKGELYWDDGETVVDTLATYNYHHFEFNFYAQTSSASLNITMTKQATNLPLQSLDNIEIFGYPYNPNLKSATLNGQPIAINTVMSSYSPFTKMLNITTTNFLNLNTGGPTWILSWNNQ